MDIDLIINTADAGAMETIREEVARLRSRSNVVSPRITFESGDATRFAFEATARGADLIVCAGGDGTLNEVVNGICAPEHAAGLNRPRIGIVPLGTGNDFAGCLGLPDTIEEAIAVATGDSEIVADVAFVNGRAFLNVSSGGLGAEATEDASDRSKRLLGSIAYLVTGVRKFASLNPSSARFVSGGETVFEGEFLFFAVGNGARTGGGVQITPKAQLADGRLDVCIAEAMPHSDFLRMLAGLRNGEHLSNEHVTYRQLSDLVVEPHGDLSVNVDGEPIVGSRFEYSLRPRAVRIAATPPVRD